MSQVITATSQVSLHFSLALDDGQLVDSTYEREQAVTFTMGDGSLLSGFEKQLIGLQAGEEKTTVVTPEDAFGQPNPNNVQRFKRSDFATDMELEIGLVLSFADANQAELPGVVQSFDEEQVMIDFNHPLAGRDITFKVTIVDVVNP